MPAPSWHRRTLSIESGCTRVREPSLSLIPPPLPLPPLSTAAAAVFSPPCPPSKPQACTLPAMLAAAATRLCASQAPLAVGLLLRGPRASLAPRPLAAPAPAQHRATGRRGFAVSAASVGPEYLVLQYDYTHHDAELLAQREPYMEDHLHLCRQAVRTGRPSWQGPGVVLASPLRNTPV